MRVRADVFLMLGMLGRPMCFGCGVRLRDWRSKDWPGLCCRCGTAARREPGERPWEAKQ